MGVSAIDPAAIFFIAEQTPRKPVPQVCSNMPRYAPYLDRTINALISGIATRARTSIPAGLVSKAVPASTAAITIPYSDAIRQLRVTARKLAAIAPSGGIEWE